MLLAELSQLIISYINHDNLLLALLKVSYFIPDFDDEFRFQHQSLDDINQILKPLGYVITINSKVDLHSSDNAFITTSEMINVVNFLMNYDLLNDERDSIFSNYNEILYQHGSPLRIVIRRGQKDEANYNVVKICS